MGSCTDTIGQTLVQRLRAVDSYERELCAEAADEIERLRAYGEACALAEREACAALMEHLALDQMDGHALAAAIRARGNP